MNNAWMKGLKLKMQKGGGFLMSSTPLISWITYLQEMISSGFCFFFLFAQVPITFSNQLFLFIYSLFFFINTQSLSHLLQFYSKYSIGFYVFRFVFLHGFFISRTPPFPLWFLHLLKIIGGYETICGFEGGFLKVRSWKICFQFFPLIC
jgi:hypothetical protein